LRCSSSCCLGVPALRHGHGRTRPGEDSPRRQAGSTCGGFGWTDRAVSGESLARGFLGSPIVSGENNCRTSRSCSSMPLLLIFLLRAHDRETTTTRWPGGSFNSASLIPYPLRRQDRAHHRRNLPHRSSPLCAVAIQTDPHAARGTRTAGTHHVQSTSCVGQRPASLVPHSSHKNRLPSGQ